MTANKKKEQKEESTMNMFPFRSLVMLIMGLIFGGIFVFGYMYIMDVHFRIPGPSIGRLRYIMLQIPPHWWMWILSGLFASLIITYGLGRLVLRGSAFQRAAETLHWKTREAFRYYKGKAEETEGRLETITAERNSITEIASEFQAQLLAIDRIRASMPRNEIIQHRLMELKKKEPEILQLPQEEPVLTFTRKTDDSKVQ
tara:strand:- start:136 stop:735 length:600 start_codon:yes stop_codon:yes gene_type:complete